jgi:mRNA-degrading endonuclease toxin of MazEF toxin-antitoxin module
VIKRGDVFLAKLGPTQGSKTDHERAAVVMSRDQEDRQSNVVLKAGEGGLAEESLALDEQVRSIRYGALHETTPAQRLTRLLGEADCREHT